jgi:lysyl-tRNA synthetase class 1
MEKHSKEELQDKHWSQILAERVISERKAPFIITGGMTTSGPAHLGTVCEFLYPAMLKQVLESHGRNAQLYFVGDILDAFDAIPYEMQKYADILAPDLGKPLVYTKDPLGCHSSFGVHYLDQAIALMKKLSLQVDVTSANDLYKSGRMDGYASAFLHDEAKVKEVVARTSMKKIEDLLDWSPIMPICEKCGKIATTRVTSHTDDAYEYACDKDVKYARGCGYSGKARLADHNYKLQWRLHWPAWQALFNSSVEGSGMDHMTKGGSATTAIAIHEEILKTTAPILFKYGFVLIEGKKYSKSKGIGMNATELSNLIPPELLKYALIVPNIEQNKDINPTGDKLIMLYGEVEHISAIKEPEKRADAKKLMAFSIAIGKLSWKASFLDMLLNYQIYRDWGKVAQIVGDEDGVRYLSPYIESWLSRGYAPERYDFTVRQGKVTSNKDAVSSLVARLGDGMTEIEVHNLIYGVAIDSGVKPDDLFASLYTALIGKDKGPRMGKLIVAIGIGKVKGMLRAALM